MIDKIVIYASVYIGLVAFIFYALGFRERMKRERPSFNEKTAPLISIIIPAYNEEKGIAATIESALSSEYPRDKLEIIVVDDGSRDKTYSIAKKYESRIVKVFTKKNGGKGTALNFGLKKSRGEIIFTMDADSLIRTTSARDQVAFFSNPRVMCVSPIVAIHSPHSILERVQQAEYLLGIFIREAFASYNAIHITPGAFSAYRKTFFEKHGVFSEKNLTEDLEMALRIQSLHYIIENCDTSVVYTHPPKTFMALAIQRRRWYTGLMRNLINYSSLFSKGYGAMGTIILPVALSAIAFSTFLTVYGVVKIIHSIVDQFGLLSAINFDIWTSLKLTGYSIQNALLELFTNPIILFLLLFVFFAFVYLRFAKTKVKEHSNVMLSLPLFFIFYATLFSFWWIISFIYLLFNKSVSWR
jgi:cellulose synthase/poly-beta-1,6-N-acetylglucosamine synthase-like glycosyltransferase